VLCTQASQVTICRLYVNLARLIYKLPDDGRRPEHVGAILRSFNVNFNVF